MVLIHLVREQRGPVEAMIVRVGVALVHRHRLGAV